MELPYFRLNIAFILTAQAFLIQHVNGSSDNRTRLELPKIERNVKAKDVWRKTRNQWFDPVLQNQSSLNGLIEKNRLDLQSRRVYLSSDFEMKASENLHRRKRSDSGLDCEGICSTSLCPWTDEWDENLNRIPRFIKYAECETRDCVFNFDGLGRHAKHKLRRKTCCGTVHTDIQVIENDQEKWLTHWPIACICVQRQAVTQVRPSNTDYYLPSITARRIPARMTNSDANQNDHISDSPSITDNNSGLRLSSFTQNQRRQLRQQQRRISQNSESFNQLMRRRARTRPIL